MSEDYTSIADLPKTGDGFVYVLGFDSGLVKIGASASPRFRVLELRSMGLCFGVELTDCWVSRSFVGYLEAEQRLCRATARRAQRVRGREWFTGVDFCEVVAVAPTLTYLHPAELAGIESLRFYSVAEVAAAFDCTEAAAQEICLPRSSSGTYGFDLHRLPAAGLTSGRPA